MSDLSPLENAAIKVLDSEPVRNLTAPVTQEIGDLLGTIANVARFYATEHLEAIFSKWSRNRHRNAKIIDATDFQRIMPLLPYASMQSDDELQSRWAALLETTASNPSYTLPSFGQTLSQITADEAKFLDRLMAASRGFPDGDGDNIVGGMSFNDLFKIYNPSLTQPVSAIDSGYDPYDGGDVILRSHAELAIDDLVRMGIISRRVGTNTSGDEYHITDASLYDYFSLSTYGRNFILAVTPCNEDGISDIQMNQP